MALKKTEVVMLRMTPPLYAASQEAAEQAGQTFADWMRHVLTEAAKKAGTWNPAGAVKAKPSKRPTRGAGRRR